MAQHVYHWKHGWIPLTHEAALSKAKGNKTRAATLLEAAHSPEAGIHSKQHVAKAALAVPTLPHADQPAAMRQVRDAAKQHGAEDVLPGARAPADLRSLSDDHLTGLLGTADDATVGRIVDEFDRRDKLERARRNATARREKRDAAREADYEKRISAGDDPEQAYADVYGVSAERQHRDQAIGTLRAQGYKGAGFDTLSASAYRDHVSEQMIHAENATRGALFAGKTRAIETRDTRRLFTDERYARAHASEELRRHWEENGGWLSLADYRASLLGGHAMKGRASWH